MLRLLLNSCYDGQPCKLNRVSPVWGHPVCYLHAPCSKLGNEWNPTDCDFCESQRIKFKNALTNRLKRDWYVNETGHLNRENIVTVYQLNKTGADQTGVGEGHSGFISMLQIKKIDAGLVSVQ